MSTISAGKYWSRYTAFVESNIGRSRDAVQNIKAGKYSPEQYWKDWAAVGIEAMELGMVPYDLVFRDLGTPTIDRAASLTAPLPLVYVIPLKPDSAIDNDLLKCQSAAAPKTIPFVSRLTTDGSCIVVSIASLAGAVTGEVYEATIHAAGAPARGFASLTLTITA